ncbi:unnamed protein product [Cunninghamella echinulata]
MRDIDVWMDEYYLEQLWNYLCNGSQIKITLIKNQYSYKNSAYIEFESENKANEMYIKYQYQPIPGTRKRYFQLYWKKNSHDDNDFYSVYQSSSFITTTNTSSSSSLFNENNKLKNYIKKVNKINYQYPLYIHHLPLDFNEFTLWSIFKPKYSSCQFIKIKKHPFSNYSMGIIYFNNRLDQQLAFVEMQNKIMDPSSSTSSSSSSLSPYLHKQEFALSLTLHSFFTPDSSSTPITTTATAINNNSSNNNLISYQQQQENNTSSLSPSENTTIFIGGLSTPLKEEELKQYFNPFGNIIYVKIPPGKGCGFVQYVSRSSAELAMKYMNGYQIGQSRIRIYWGKSQHQRNTSPPSLSSNSSSSLISSSSLSTTATFRQQQYHQSDTTTPTSYPSLTIL